MLYIYFHMLIGCNFLIPNSLISSKRSAVLELSCLATASFPFIQWYGIPVSVSVLSDFMGE